MEGRLESLAGLAREREPERREALLGALADSSWRVRKAAVEAILRLGSAPEVLSGLIECLAAPDNAGLRNAASETLVAFGDLAISSVREALSSIDPDLRLFCCNILGQIGNPAAVPNLAELLADPDGNVRTAAIENLGSFALPEARDALISVLESGDVPSRFSALEALAHQEAYVPVDVLARLLKQKLLRKPVFDVLASGAYPDAFDLLTEGLADPAHSCRDAALRAWEATIEMDPGKLAAKAAPSIRERLDLPALQRIAQSLESEDQSVRRAAVRVLGLSGRLEGAEILLNLGQDEGVHDVLRDVLAQAPVEIADAMSERFVSLPPGAQAVALLLLAKQRHPQALGFARAGLRSTFGHLVRSACEAAGEIEDVESAPVLAGLLGHAYPDVRAAAAWGLGRLGAKAPEKVLDAARGALSSPVSAARVAYARALGGFASHAGAAEHILGLLRDADPQVRAEAANAIQGAKLEETPGALISCVADEDPAVRRAAALSLGSFSDAGAREGLSLALRDPDIWVRCEAARSLGRAGDRSSLDLAEQALAAKDTHPLVAARLLEALEGAAPARAALQAAALLDHGEPDVVGTAVEVLDRASPEAARAAASRVEALLKHPHWQVRSRAATFLGRMGDTAALGRAVSSERDPLVLKAFRAALLAPGGGR